MACRKDEAEQTPWSSPSARSCRNRRKGCNFAWEQVKYGEIFQRRSKMGVSTPALPSVEYDDINPGMGTLNKDPKRSKGTSKRGIHFNPGDVLFGKLRPYLKNWLFACFEGVAVGDFWVLTSSKIDHGFIYSLIQAPGFQYIANLSSGSKMPRSDWGLVSNARTFIPTNLSEQESISSVLFSLDTTITLHEEKKRQLERLKSALLQKMFADKSGYPDIRFEDFSGEWEQCKLGNVAKITMGQSPNSKNYTDNPKDRILVQGNADMKDGQVHPRIWTTEITKTANKGDLILSVRAPVGDIGKTSYDVVIGRGVAAIKGNEFIFQLLKRMKAVGYWTKYSTGSTFESINSLEINNAVINLPKEHEQNEVGNILSYVDHAITLQNYKIKLVKKLKSSLLQKMFI
ncbi:hypothetical protein BTI17_05315 [Lactobacillus delbrueckii subsp. bulgaricus]|nr:hypothetical protein [Lactobacillus delbrueckii subsp. bulgaricus]MBT8963501.1 hypothetical protein [Lactobacillus delbrueckii subsp. bulgaricus]MBT8971162.1 hypothetical protein [Lactobacillus delbrueckii subsp. bulgaricus]